jgi:hypothetical protein
LVAGGSNGTRAQSSAELYDPATGTFALTASMNRARIGPAAAVVLGSYVVIVGGSDGSGALPSAELYGPIGS